MNDIFNISNYNVIQDNEYYYFFRALNMGDNRDIAEGITTSSSGKIEKVRTDRQRFEGQPKYSEEDEISLEQLYDHIKMHYIKETNCISLTSNGNVAIDYGRGFYTDKYIMVRVPKKEFGEKVVVAGEYMLQELSKRIDRALENVPEEQKKEIAKSFLAIENSKNNKELQELIERKYTAKKDEVRPSKACLRKNIVYRGPKGRISSYQALNDEQLIELNKIYAKLSILENEKILKHVISHSSNSGLRQAIGNAFSSLELIHYGEIHEDEIVEVSKEIVDIFALIQQAEDIEKEDVEKLKRAVLEAVKQNVSIPAIPEIETTLQQQISIEDMYELTNGMVEYGKSS